MIDCWDYKLVKVLWKKDIQISIKNDFNNKLKTETT